MPPRLPRRLDWSLATLATLATLVASIAIAGPLAALEPTPAQTEGPYYPTRRPAESDADLTRVGNGPVAIGQVLQLKGRVVDVDGAPIEAAQVEIWQTDHQGIYMHPGDRQTAKRDMAFQFYGETRTDAGGAFAFRTILPAAYAGRPRHIHAKVTPPGGTTLTTQFYFAGDDLARDGIASRLGKAVQRLTLVPEAASGENGSVQAAITVVVRRARGG